MGAGLGGGSADAAAVLRWAGCTDLSVAAGIGADVPFCLVAGRARVRGIGEVLEPLPFEDRVFTLLTPPLHVSTPAVYAAWDSLGGPVAEGPNDLEPAALVVAPSLASWRRPRSGWKRRNVVRRRRIPGCARGCRHANRPPLGAAGPTIFFGLLALLAGPALPARRLEHLLVLLLSHALAALLDQRTHVGA
jgi:hypothetical protein